MTANAAAVSAQVHRTQQEALAKVTYKVLVSDDPADCNNHGAFASEVHGIHVCPNAGDDPQPHNAYYKFVVAHEFGHHVEQLGGGTIPSVAVENPYTVMDQNLPALCTCAHVVPKESGLHCLQSQEVYSVGSVEGFGQFFATRVWNDPGAAAPRFQYYKQFKENANTELPAGAKVVNVKQTPVRWGQTRCTATAAGRSTEYDFLGFYWAINTAAPNERTSLPELYSIMKNVGANPADTQDRGSWAIYRAGALTTYGPSNPKFAKFDASGPTFGVNN